MIWQLLANPRMRPMLRFYPEDAGSILEEPAQAERWLHEVDPHLLTPMYHNPHTHLDFYIFEPTQQCDGGLCIPFRFFVRHQILYARVWPLVVGSGSDGRLCWIVEHGHEYEYPAEDFLHTAVQLFHGVYLGEGMPDIHKICSSHSFPPFFPYTITKYRWDLAGYVFSLFTSLFAPSTSQVVFPLSLLLYFNLLGDASSLSG